MSHLFIVPCPPPGNHREVPLLDLPACLPAELPEISVCPIASLPELGVGVKILFARNEGDGILLRNECRNLTSRNLFWPSGVSENSCKVMYMPGVYLGLTHVP